jgi:hypothetical protein
MGTYLAHSDGSNAKNTAKILKVYYFLTAGCTAVETKHVIVQEINEEH